MNRSIILIAPEPPPFGGMANQARLLADCLAKEKVRVCFVPTNRAPGLFSENLWVLPVFRTFGKAGMYMAGLLLSVSRCSAIHILACSHAYFYINVIPAVLIGRIFKKRVVINYRGGEAAGFFKGSAKYFLWVFRLADSLIVPSGFLKSVFYKLGVDARIIPNISEVERFHFSLPVYKNHVKFICTRNFESYYDIMTLVRAFNLVKKHLPGPTLTLIGAGSLKQQVIDYVKKNNLIDVVNFPGKVEPKDMQAHLEQHDIYVNSSVVDNYPISLLEAFSSGLPVISTAAGGIPFMVEHGENAILVPPKDHQSLAKEMVRVANDVMLGRYLAVNAKRFADEHSWEKIWPKLKPEYNWTG